MLGQDGSNFPSEQSHQTEYCKPGSFCLCRFLLLPLLIAPLIFGFAPASAEVNEAGIEAIVKNAPCRGQTIEDALKSKIHIRSQRDLGWRIFSEDGHFEAERAFLMNKSMQLRFRWRVNDDGSISPVSKRAETLCTAEEE